MEKVEVLSFLDDNAISFSDRNIDLFLAKHLGEGKVCFTGSRPMSLPWKFNENCDLFIEFHARLKSFIEKLVDAGFNHFITGMALGFDTYAAESVLEKKRGGKPAYLECAIPFEKQAARWSQEQINRYNSVLKHADKITYVSNEFDMGCYARRNEYMVKNASLVVALQIKPDGGTAATIKLAKKYNKPIILFK